MCTGLMNKEPFRMPLPPGGGEGATLDIFG